MKKNKYYFNVIIEYEISATIPEILQEMKKHNIQETTVFDVVRDTGSGMFYCNEYMEFGDSGEKLCNKKDCYKYQPRNKKSGCCIHRRHCYIEGDEYLLKQNGDLINKQNDKNN